ncbi:MAG: transporter [Desulfobacterales bacterium]|nr:MAG: transporter [Desulfobacterales bacterium]
MFRSFFGSKKWLLWAYGGGVFLIGLICLQVYLTVLLNKWYGAFYNIIQNVAQRSMSEYWEKIWEFGEISVPLVIIGMSSAYLARVYTFYWREAMTFSYVARWREVKKDIEGSSQRIQEDIYRFARIVESLGLQVIRAILTLVAFLPLLWQLSSKVDVPVIKDIPGGLVWVALIVSIGGLVISWIVGLMLPILEYNNQKVEAAYRKELVYAEDDKRNFASEESIIDLFLGLKRNYYRLFRHYTYFDAWIHSFERVMMITPYLIMAPSLFSGLIALGVMVQVSNAFGRVRASLSIFTMNWTTITELRSIYRRLKEFEKNIGY